jgi:L-malate glycosyltransferase
MVMKVLFTFFNPSGGMETLNRIRCQALAERGVECHLLYTISGEGRKNIRNIPTLITNRDEEIREMLQREAFDIIVVCTDIYLAERIRGLGYTGPLIFEVQGLGTLDEAHQILSEFTERITWYADALLYPETGHLKSLFTVRFPSIPQFCYDNPVEGKDFGYTSYPPRPYPIIGWIGRIQANKNWREFLQLGQNLLNIHPELYLWLFQDNTLYDVPEKESFDQYIAHTGLSSRLISYSNVPHEQMADYLSMIGDSGGLLCSTSILEGFGYAVAEAMLCRCPVLTTDSDGIRRLVIHNKTGIIYTRGHIGEAVNSALSLMNNHPLRTRIRDNAERHIRENLSAELYVDRFMQMCQHLKK